MHFRHLGEGLGAMLGDEIATDGFDLGGGSFGEGGLERGTQLLQAADKFVAGEDGGGRHGGVILSAVALDELEVAAEGEEGALDGVGGGGELVADGPDGGWDHAMALEEEVFEDSSMPPGEDAIHGAIGAVHAVVGFGTDGDDRMDGIGGGPDDLGEAGDLEVGTDTFGIADAGGFPGIEDAGIDIDTGDAEGPEEIAFAGFVDSDAGVEALGIEGVLIAEAGLLEDGGFEGELDEFLGTLALDEEFEGFVEGDLEAGLGSGDTGMGDGA